MSCRGGPCPHRLGVCILLGVLPSPWHGLALQEGQALLQEAAPVGMGSSGGWGPGGTNLGQLAKLAMVAQIRACPLPAPGSLAECVPWKHAPSWLVQDPGKCLSPTRSDVSPEEVCEGSRAAPRCCTHIAYPLEEGQPLGTELSLLRSLAVSPPHGTGQLCLWAPMGCTSAVLALLHLPSARGSQDKVGSSPAAPGLEKTRGDTIPGTWLPPRPSFRAFLRKKEQHRKEGNKAAQQWGMIGWLFSALVGSRDTPGSAITSPRRGC